MQLRVKTYVLLINFDFLSKACLVVYIFALKEYDINRHQLSLRRLQKEEALKARVVKANETGEKEKVPSLPRFYLFFWL